MCVEFVLVFSHCLMVLSFSYRPMEVNVLSSNGKHSWLDMVLKEGKVTLVFLAATRACKIDC